MGGDNSPYPGYKVVVGIKHKFLSGQVNTKQWVRCTLAEATCNGASQCIRCENLSMPPDDQYRTVEQPCCKGMGGWV